MNTKNFNEAFEFINELLEDSGHELLTERFAREDCNIQGGETTAELLEFANGYMSEISTEQCCANEWGY
jgi:hypothetical protein